MRLDGSFGAPFLVDSLEVHFTPFLFWIFGGCSVGRLDGIFRTPFLVDFLEVRSTPFFVLDFWWVFGSAS